MTVVRYGHGGIIIFCNVKKEATSPPHPSPTHERDWRARVNIRAGPPPGKK